MLEAMRRLALARLRADLDPEGIDDPEVWYQRLRATDPGQLFFYLVEDVDEEGSGRGKPRYYTLAADSANPEVAVLEAHELRAGDAARLPFNQPSGSQSPALGPLLKRTVPTSAKGAGPSLKIQQTTLKAFAEIGQGNSPWSGYFRAAHTCWTLRRLRIGEAILDARENALQEAIERIEEKRTVFLAYRTSDGRLPGEVPEYVAYLQQVLADTKYGTAAYPALEDKTCSLCGQAPVRVYRNALRGAGFNLANLDRPGAFPNLDPANAWKTFGVCVGCADRLYVYCRHVAPCFVTSVAGERALVLPNLGPDHTRHRRLLERVRDWVRAATPQRGKDAVTVPEHRLLRLLGEEAAVVTLDILWAEFGNRIEDVRGVVTDVLPSRLRYLDEMARRINEMQSPLFPEQPIEGFAYDVSLGILEALLRRPGGRAAQKSNESRRLFDLRRDLAEAIYHCEALPAQFWTEVHTTARWHWDDACAKDQPVYHLLHEGYSPKKKEGFLTLAGWIKQLARFRYYLHLLRIEPMTDTVQPYQPSAEILKPYFGPESALRGKPERAFAFILGALYGKLLQIQAKRAVNVQANALTWLRRLTLAGPDLPGLYIKVREKLLVYRAERIKVVRALIAELGELGTRLGTSIPLDETETCYFLLLGQSLATKIMPSKPKPGAQP